MPDSARPTERPSDERAPQRGPHVRGLGRAASRPGGGRALDVVDIGGGTGGFAVRVAELGHRVTVVDPSPDALASLDRRARELGVEVAGQQGDLSTLLDVTGPASADVVLCHGVLEVVDDPAAALATLRAVLRPGGHAQPAGRPAARRRRRPGDGRPLRPGAGPARRPGGRCGRRGGHRFTDPEAVRSLTERRASRSTAVHGVRVFADLVPGSLLDLEPGATAALVELERAVSERAEFRPLATQLHLLAAERSPCFRLARGNGSIDEFPQPAYRDDQRAA